jgi:hypothetical protein
LPERQHADRAQQQQNRCKTRAEPGAYFEIAQIHLMLSNVINGEHDYGAFATY